MLDRAGDVEPPVFLRDIRGLAQIEDWPILDQMLARRQSAVLGPRRHSGQEFAQLRPFGLGLGELAIVGRVGHGNLRSRPRAWPRRVQSQRSIAGTAARRS